MSPCSLFVRGRTDCKLVRGPDGAGAAVEGVRCAPLDTVGRDMIHTWSVNEKRRDLTCSICERLASAIDPARRLDFSRALLRLAAASFILPRALGSCLHLAARPLNGRLGSEVRVVVLRSGNGGLVPRS